MLAAGAGASIPWTGYDDNTSFQVPGRPEKPGDSPHARYQRASPGYFEALRWPLRSGRLFEPGDRGAISTARIRWGGRSISSAARGVLLALWPMSATIPPISLRSLLCGCRRLRSLRTDTLSCARPVILSHWCRKCARLWREWIPNCRWRNCGHWIEWPQRRWRSGDSRCWYARRSRGSGCCLPPSASTALLYGVSATDKVTFAVAPSVILLAALLASAMPGLLAARSQPMTALRDE